MPRYYAGIGSRQTPPEVLVFMARLAALYAMRGWTLRSGGAGGADSAFERGCDSKGGRKQIFLPWDGFSDRRAEQGRMHTVHAGVSEAALALAESFHPGWAHCSRGARALHARNCYQVLGLDLASPIELAFCWTPGGKGGGGTGQALRLSKDRGIPIYDLGLSSVWDRVQALLDLGAGPSDRINLADAARGSA